MIHNARWLKLLLLALAASLAPRACADEPVEAFLEALRLRQMYDEAIDYLDLLGGQPHLAEHVKQRILYEQGVTLLESASRLSDLGARETQLSRAGELFAKFQTSFPQHELAAAAKNQSANILVERGRAKVELARQARPKEPVLAEARKFFEQAREQFTAAEKDLDAQWQKFPKLPAEKELQTQKRQVAGDLVQVRMLRAGIDYELAKTFDAHSAEAKKHLKTAVQSFAAIDDAYRTRAAGLLARLWQGRCYQEMGEIKHALGCYQELMDLPTNSETRSIKTKSTRQALECWTKDSEKKYQEAIERGERWEKESGGQQTDADSLAIRYLTALAYQAQASALPSKDPNRKKLASVARQYVGPVANHPGEYQRPAKMLLVALAAKDKKEQKDSKIDPVTFAEAFERGNQASEQVQEADLALKLAQAKSDKAAVENLKRQKKESTAAARAAFQLALTLSDKKVAVEDLNSVRWYLCYFAWDAGQYYDAAVMGEFLARRYPDSPRGRQGARVALAAYLRLYAENQATEKDFEASHLQAVAEYTFKTWPDQEEADEAALTLLNFAASQKQLDKVTEYLGKVAANSPRRGQAELRAGQALWSEYLRGAQSPPDERPKQEQLDQLKKQAHDVLAKGVSRMEKVESVDATLPAAVFALAQICVDTGQPDKAIEWLEHPKIGPLTLVKAKSPLAAREGFAIESYKLALRAYVAAGPQQLKKAEDAMDALEKLVQGTGDAKAAENLTAIYIGLGRELQQHLQELRKTGKKNELEAVSKAFEVFLDRVTKRTSGNSYASLNWVGETYYNLAIGFDEGGPALGAKSKTYFQKATNAYQRMLEFAEKDPKLEAEPGNLIGVRLRLADCYKRAGKFDEAIQVLLAVLREKPMLITAQVQAAQTYQARGVVDPAAYALAITGSTPGKNGQNAIWGWNQLSRTTTAIPKYEETFHQARLNMAESRLQYALAQKDKAKRNKILEAAKQDLWSTYKVHPKLGGKETAAKYDRQLKQIQKELGNKANGLDEFKERDAAAAAAAAK